MTKTPDFRALFAELIDKIGYTWGDIPLDVELLVDRARTALATPPPEPPTDEDLDSLWDELFSCDDTVSSGDVKVIARAAIERWGNNAI
jgi:hypothetical protein